MQNASRKMQIGDRNWVKAHLSKICKSSPISFKIRQTTRNQPQRRKLGRNSVRRNEQKKQNKDQLTCADGVGRVPRRNPWAGRPGRSDAFVFCFLFFFFLLRFCELGEHGRTYAATDTSCTRTGGRNATEPPNAAAIGWHRRRVVHDAPSPKRSGDFSFRIR